MTAATLVRTMVAMVPWPMRQHIKNIPGVAQAQRFLVSRLLDGAEFQHRVDAGPAKGVTFALRMPDDKGILTGAYEIDLATRLAKAIRAGDVAYDIGSWHGFFAGVMVASGARQVHVFEPLPANTERLETFISLNPERDIRLHKCAVGAAPGEMDLVVMPETSMAKLEASDFQKDVLTGDRVRVRVVSIDDMVASGQLPLPQVMKVDVEGAELLVFKGALDTIRRAKPQIFCEVHSSGLLEACEEFFSSLGYGIEHLDRDPNTARARDVFQVRAFPAS